MLNAAWVAALRGGTETRLVRVRPALCGFATGSRARLKAPALGSAASVIAVPSTQATPPKELAIGGRCPPRRELEKALQVVTKNLPHDADAGQRCGRARG